MNRNSQVTLQIWRHSLHDETARATLALQHSRTGNDESEARWNLGDRVAIEAESHGEHASGKLYNNHYHFLMRLRDGKIVRFKEYFDTEHATEVLCGGQRPA